MRGTIDKVWENEYEGKPWKKVEIDGEQYSIWDEPLFALAVEGNVIEFEFKEDKKQRRKLTKATLIETEPQGQPTNYADKQIQISRLSLLKTAVEWAPEGASLNTIINTAMRLEEYVLGEIDLAEPEQEVLDEAHNPSTPPPWGTEEEPAKQLPTLAEQRKITRNMILEMCSGDADVASSYLFRKVKQREFKNVTTKEFADLKVTVEEDYAAWVEKEGGPFGPVEEQ